MSIHMKSVVCLFIALSLCSVVIAQEDDLTIEVTSGLSMSSFEFDLPPLPHFSPAPQAEVVNEPAPVVTPFTEGSMYLSFTAGAYQEYKGEETVVAGTAAFSYYVVNDLAFVGELVGYGVDNLSGPDSEAVGFNIMARWHFIKDGDFSAFFEGGAGVFQANEQTPSGGTHFNFTPQLGLGITYRLWDNVHLIVAGRYFHLSNASIEGVNRNPSIDGFGGYAGLLFQF